MKKSISRRLRRPRSSHDMARPTKEGKEPKFFGSEGSEPFFQPTTPIQRTAEDETIHRAAEGPEKEKEKEKVARAAEPEKKEEKMQRAAEPEKKKEEEKVQRAAEPEKKEEKEKVQKKDSGDGGGGTGVKTAN